MIFMNDRQFETRTALLEELWATSTETEDMQRVVSPKTKRDVFRYMGTVFFEELDIWVEEGLSDPDWEHALTLIRRSIDAALPDGLKETPSPSGDPSEELAERPSRLQAQSVAFYYLAKQRSDVRAFRSEVLGGTLVEPADLSSWVHSHLGWDDGKVGDDRIEFEYYKFDPDLGAQGGLRSAGAGVVAKIGGQLHTLKRLATNLHAAYGWGVENGITFVLTDRIPITVGSLHKVTRRSPYMSASRIELSLDPGLSQVEVIKAFEQARNALFYGRKQRVQTSKHLRLAVTAAQRGDSETWIEVMQRWNGHLSETDINNKYRYSNTGTFARDCREALKRLTGLEEEND